jgi:hypothetical protein
MQWSYSRRPGYIQLAFSEAATKERRFRTKSESVGADIEVVGQTFYEV